jgi:hypothetical protein
VTLASRPEDEGKKLQEVADKNDNKAEASLQAEQELLRRSGKAPVLIERQTGRPVVATPEAQENNNEDNNQNNPPQPQPQLKHRGTQNPRR